MQARSDLKSDNTVRAMAMSLKTILETIPDTEIRFLPSAVGPLILRWIRRRDRKHYSTELNRSKSLKQSCRSTTSQSTVRSNQAKSPTAVTEETQVTEVMDEPFPFVSQQKRASTHCHIATPTESRAVEGRAVRNELQR